MNVYFTRIMSSDTLLDSVVRKLTRDLIHFTSVSAR